MDEALLFSDAACPFNVEGLWDSWYCLASPCCARDAASAGLTYMVLTGAGTRMENAIGDAGTSQGRLRPEGSHLRKQVQTPLHTA